MEPQAADEGRVCLENSVKQFNPREIVNPLKEQTVSKHPNTIYTPMGKVLVMQEVPSIFQSRSGHTYPIRKILLAVILL